LRRSQSNDDGVGNSHTAQQIGLAAPQDPDPTILIGTGIGTPSAPRRRQTDLYHLDDHGAAAERSGRASL
jgi:hypothetical protein